MLRVAVAKLVAWQPVLVIMRQKRLSGRDRHAQILHLCITRHLCRPEMSSFSILDFSKSCHVPVPPKRSRVSRLQARLRTVSGAVQHGPCTHPCDRKLTCGHHCPAACHSGSACPPCAKPCWIRCTHRKCGNKCGEVCTLCVSNCDWACGHQGRCTAPCAAPCDRLVGYMSES